MFNLGQAIKDLRQALGLSQEELASGICNQAQISNLENNNAMPSALLLNQIATKLGVDMNYFFEMQESYKVEYLQNSKKYIRKVIRMRDYESLYDTVLLEKKHPYYQEPENLQFLLWHEAISIHYIESNPSKALKILDEALQITNNKQYNTEQEIEILNSIAVIHRETGNYGEAETRFREALKKFEEVPRLTNSHIEIRLVFGLAQLLTDIEKFKESLEWCKKGIRLCKKYDTLYIYGELLYQSGENLARLGEKARAKESLDQSIKIFELQGNAVLVKSVQENRSILLEIEET
ncbi:helix-turn-helix domain-containing protein [Robertmurraya kyonggiensis]|uniref:Tetratricopeptide repeat protein n=1 Tax=Robertmurraya kyonggiensis TaxID=1037680 RepID=A0A4U1D937_9BACI|nr:tetratricopeptide repeat protein [Robertmurraya kyonggiensis]TKC19012.1 tetratricopeptide repeat protein [Robertmurraya kyonggiensis]